MREDGPVRFRFEGAAEAAQGYIGQARTLLGILKNQMRLGGLQQLSREITLSDGTRLFCQSVFGQDTIRITAEAGGVGQVETREEREYSTQPVFSVGVMLPNQIPYTTALTFAGEITASHREETHGLSNIIDAMTDIVVITSDEMRLLTTSVNLVSYYSYDGLDGWYSNYDVPVFAESSLFGQWAGGDSILVNHRGYNTEVSFSASVPERCILNHDIVTDKFYNEPVARQWLVSSQQKNEARRSQWFRKNSVSQIVSMAKGEVAALGNLWDLLIKVYAPYIIGVTYKNKLSVDTSSVVTSDNLDMGGNFGGHVQRLSNTKAKLSFSYQDGTQTKSLNEEINGTDNISGFLDTKFGTTVAEQYLANSAYRYRALYGTSIYRGDRYGYWSPYWYTFWIGYTDGIGYTYGPWGTYFNTFDHIKYQNTPVVMNGQATYSGARVPDSTYVPPGIYSDIVNWDINYSFFGGLPYSFWSSITAVYHDDVKYTVPNIVEEWVKYRGYERYPKLTFKNMFYKEVNDLLPGATISITPFSPVRNGRSLGVFPFVPLDHSSWSYNSVSVETRLMLGGLYLAVHSSLMDFISDVKARAVAVKADDAIVNYLTTRYNESSNLINNVALGGYVSPFWWVAIPFPGWDQVTSKVAIRTAVDNTLFWIQEGYRVSKTLGAESKDTANLTRKVFSAFGKFADAYYQASDFSYDPFRDCEKIELYGKFVFKYDPSDGHLKFDGFFPLVSGGKTVNIRASGTDAGDVEYFTLDEQGRETVVPPVRIDRPKSIWPEYNAVVEYRGSPFSESRLAHKIQTVELASEVGDRFMKAVLDALRP